MKLDFITHNRNFTYAAIAVGAGTIIYGAVKSGQAKKEAKKLQANRPQLEASPYLDSQISLAESELANGMSARSEQMYNNATDRQVSSQLNSLLKGGASINNVSELFDATDVGRQRFALMNDNIRMQNIQNLARAQGGAEGFRQTQFEFNQFRPYADQAQGIAQARQGAAQMVNNGVNTFAGGFSRFAENRGWGQGQQNAAAPANQYNVSGEQPGGSTYIPQSGIYNQFPSAPTTAPNMPLNYNNTYGYTPWQNRPQ